MNTATIQKVETAFLLTGPTMHLDIPSSFRGIAELSSPINIGGSSGRSVDFIRPPVDGGFTDPDFISLAPVAGADGRTVAVQQRVEEPVHWFLIWELANGMLVTHVREEDGLSAARLVASRITVVEHSGRPPSVLLGHPVTHMISRRPGYHEEILFLEASDHPAAYIRMRRPGALRDGDRRVAGRLADNSTVGSVLGIDISVGGDVSQREAFEVAEMVREGVAESARRQWGADRAE